MASAELPNSFLHSLGHHLRNALRLHNRDIDHKMCGNWGINGDLPHRHDTNLGDKLQLRHFQTVSSTVWTTTPVVMTMTLPKNCKPEQVSTVEPESVECVNILESSPELRKPVLSGVADFRGRSSIPGALKTPARVVKSQLSEQDVNPPQD